MAKDGSYVPLSSNPYLSGLAMSALKSRQAEAVKMGSYGLGQMGRTLQGLEIEPFMQGLTPKEKAEISATLADALTRLASLSSSLQVSKDGLQREAMVSNREIWGKIIEAQIKKMEKNGEISNTRAKELLGRSNQWLEQSRTILDKGKLESTHVSAIQNALQSEVRGELVPKLRQTLASIPPEQRREAVQMIESNLTAKYGKPVKLSDPNTMSGTSLQGFSLNDDSEMRRLVIEGQQAAIELETQSNEALRNSDAAYLDGMRQGAGFNNEFNALISAANQAMLTGEGPIPSDYSASSSGTTSQGAPPAPSAAPPASPSAAPTSTPAPPPGGTPVLGTAPPASGGSSPSGSAPAAAAPSTGGGGSSPPPAPGQQAPLMNPNGSVNPQNVQMPSGPANRVSVSGPTSAGQARVDAAAEEVMRQIDALNENPSRYAMMRSYMTAQPQFQEWMAANGYTDIDMAFKYALQEAKANARNNRRETRQARDAAILGGAAVEGAGLGEQMRAAISGEGAPATPAQKFAALYREQGRREVDLTKKGVGAAAAGVQWAGNKIKDRVEAELIERRENREPHLPMRAYDEELSSAEREATVLGPPPSARSDNRPPESPTPSAAETTQGMLDENTPMVDAPPTMVDDQGQRLGPSFFEEDAETNTNSPTLNGALDALRRRQQAAQPPATTPPPSP